MGILDHTRTWHFETTMTPDECVAAFTEALESGRAMSLMGSNWRVTASGDNRKAIAVYQGRSAVASVLTAASRRSSSEQEAAAGSQLSFATAVSSRGTTCTMALTRVTKIYFFFTADARFLRSAMNRVARRLRARDTGLELVKQ